MQARDESKAETVFGVTVVLTAGGALTFALFPLALPMVVLLGVLAVPLLPLALLGLLGAIAYRTVRSISRRLASSASRSIPSAASVSPRPRPWPSRQT
jgi:hypothetical protein